MSTWGAALLVSALVWLSSPSAQAQTVTITQLTDTGANFEPSLSGSGTRVAFRSFTNLANPAGCPVLPGNPDFTGEIYLFDTGTGCFTQVTSTTTGTLFDARISADGNRIAFIYNGDLANPGSCAALPGNADGNFEVYLFNTVTGCFTQVTNTTGGGSFGPALNAAGTRVAFESQSNLVNPGGCPVLPGNADGNIEVYLFDVGTGCFTQVTSTTGGGQGGSSLNAAGTRLAFVSNRNLANPVGCPALPGNASINTEIYLFNTVTGCLTQVTNTSGGQNDFPSLSGSGNQLAFASTVNLVNRVGCAGLPGLPDNADGNFEIYLFDVTTGCFTQVTNTTGGSNIFSSLSANGTRIAFRSTANLANPTGCPALPGNADGNKEIYLYDLGTRCFTQITNTTPSVDITGLSVDATGTRVAFDADTDDSDSEILLAVVTLPAPAVSVPTLSEWAQLALIALLVLGGVRAVRRRAAQGRHGDA